MDEEIKGLKSLGRQQVEEVPYGMYVWELPSGEVLGDGEDNIMNVFCMKGNRKAIAALAAAARSYGFPEGKPVWWAGKRRINDEELEEQQQREKFGLEPDPLNYPALRDQMRERHGR
jgi:hypothetical protein